MKLPHVIGICSVYSSALNVPREVVNVAVFGMVLERL